MNYLKVLRNKVKKFHLPYYIELRYL